jgi:hypothetical protein
MKRFKLLTSTLVLIFGFYSLAPSMSYCGTEHMKDQVGDNLWETLKMNWKQETVGAATLGAGKFLSWLADEQMTFGGGGGALFSSMVLYAAGLFIIAEPFISNYTYGNDELEQWYKKHPEQDPKNAKNGSIDADIARIRKDLAVNDAALARLEKEVNSRHSAKANEASKKTLTEKTEPISLYPTFKRKAD